MKKLLSVFLCMFFCVLVPTAPVSANESVLELSAKSAILIEQKTGKILYEKNPHEKLYPASVTKIMTMLLTLEALDNKEFTLDDMVKTSSLAASMGGSQVFLEENEQMSVDDMLKAVAVASGNDAAVALAEFVAGSHEGFVDKMNARAKELNMKNTTFKNCTGLPDENHKTTAFDIAQMSKELMGHKKILDYTTIWMDTLRDGKFGLVNTNKLIRFYDGATGLKTGSTSDAGFCMSATATRNKLNLIAVVMGAPSSKERFSDASKLLNHGFSNYTISDSLLNDDELKSINLKKGVKPDVKIGIDENFCLLLEKSKISSIEKKLSLPSVLNAPINENDKIGEVEFFIDKKSIGKADILAKETVKALGFLSYFKKLSSFLFFGA